MSRKTYVLYAHDGSGNHGCEALVRSTCTILNVDKQNAVLMSTRPEEDRKYGLSDICTVLDKTEKRPLNRTKPAFFKAYYSLKIKHNYTPIEFYESKVADFVKKGDIALSIGGDTYCYGSFMPLFKAHNMYKYGGLKTVYWGCSIEPELLENPDIAQDIKKFDLITARETTSYEALKKVNPNTVLVCDSAFLLPQKEVAFPEQVKTDVVGINASPLIEDCENGTGIVRQNYEKLIEYILNNTDMCIALVPHVVWEAVDDRKILNYFYEKYKNTNRVFLIDDCPCEELKGYIAKCRFFIGARTHSTIAAYSSNVPTLVVGYSVKARGIAKDLFGTWENYVLPAQEIQKDIELTDNFKWLQKNESNIKEHLSAILPEYKNRINNGINALKKL
ncbi:MAG: polysaccharide pyruvyl transferase family protein [Clostridia bacterium]|nr:polysaccharide pyruvyl transferase family protein [Clostridia bacterium]